MSRAKSPIRLPPSPNKRRAISQSLGTIEISAFGMRPASILAASASKMDAIGDEFPDNGHAAATRRNALQSLCAR
jgi:hypothetical protein